ncbi:MAG: Delta-60 repeat-containing protein [Thermoleophilia bacterium]|nr:Delta-60 repeat-containing protein [Thermoleophilia bacterium]
MLARSFRTSLLVLSMAIAATGIAPQASAAPGDVDTSYGSAGVATFGADTGTMLGRLEQDADGSSVYVAGYAYSGAGNRYRYQVGRHTIDGSAGVVGLGTNLGASHHTTFADLVRITVGAHAGKYVGVLRSDDGLTLVRLMSTLQPDSTFGNALGEVVVAPAASGLYEAGLAVDAAGNYLVLSNVGGVPPMTARVHKIKPDGTPDTDFGTTGVALVPQGEGPATSGSDIAVAADGSIYVGGSPQGAFTMVRLTANGVADPTFDANGVARIAVNGLGGAVASELLLQADGKIVLAGGYGVFELVRWNSDGSIDTSFGGGDGHVETVRVDCCPGSDGAMIYGLAQQQDGRLLAGGRMQLTTDSRTRLALVRYNVDGSLDASFGSAGIVWDAPTLATGSSVIRDVVVQPTGNILVSAVSGGSSTRELIRFKGGRPPAADFTHPTAFTGDDVTFTSTSTATAPATVASMSWSVDGAAVATTPTLHRTFADHSSHTVALTVTDSNGNVDTVSKSVSVFVRPEANFEYSPTPPYRNETMTFTSTATATSPSLIVPSQIEWDVDGDGVFNATGVTVTHAFSTLGDHLVRLRVTDSSGGTDEVSRVVTTQARPELPPTDTTPHPSIESIPGTLTPIFTAGLKRSTAELTRMPAYVAKRFTVDQVQNDLGMTRDLNVQYVLKPGPVTSLPKAKRATARPYEVFATKPAAGSALKSSFPAPAQVVTLSYYDPKVPKDANCPYADGKIKTGRSTLDMWAVIRGMGVFEGADQLDDLGCNYEITGLDYTSAVNESSLYKFAAVTVKGKRLLRVRIGSPRQPDFRAAFNEPLQPDFETELGLADDAQVVAADQNHSMGVTVIERATGRFAQYLPVKLLDPSGDVIAAGRTDAGGFVHMQYSFKERTGSLRLVMELTDPRTGDILMSGIQTLPIVQRPDGWTDMNGNGMVRDTASKLLRFKRSGVVRGTSRSGRLLKTAASNDLYEPMLQSLQEMYTVLYNRLGLPGKAIAAAVVDSLRLAIAQKSPEDIARQTGFSVGIMGNGMAPLRTDGTLAQGIGSSSVSIIGSNGSTLLAAGGAGIISGGAGNIISGGAGNIISGGAGNIISGGAGNIISGGGGNIISGGAGNIISGGAGNIISGGAGNLVRSGSALRARSPLAPGVVAGMAFQSTRYAVDVRSFKVRELEDTTVIVNLDGTLPAGTLIARGFGATPIVLPGKLR